MMEYYNIALHFSTTNYFINNNKKNFCILQTWTHIIEAPPPSIYKKTLYSSVITVQFLVIINK